MNYLILLQRVGGDYSPQRSPVTIALIVLMALAVIGMAVFIGYKAFQPKNKK